MNGRTAKLLNRIAARGRVPARVYKSAWWRFPAKARARVRREALAEVHR